MKRVLLLAVLAILPVLAWAPAVAAATTFTVFPNFPAIVSVGQVNVAGSIKISAPSSGGNVTMTSIDLVPACGTGVVTNGVCPPASADPNVFRISPTGAGEPGTACAGTTFNIAVFDMSTGEVNIVPAGGPVVLTANAVCTIDFTFDVLKAPTKSSGTSPADTVLTDPAAFGNGITSMGAVSSTGVTMVQVSTKAIPTITTAPAAGVAAGGGLSATAAVSGGSAPTGNVTFQLYSNGFCGAPPASTTTGALSGGSASSGNVAVAAAGTYSWLATYNGDAGNLVVHAPCSAVTVSKATPSISTAPAPNAVIGGVISDQATVSGGSAPSGSVTFQLYGPGDPSCAAAPVFAVTSTLGSGAATTGNLPAPAPGTYHWAATYNGDDNNNPVTSPCASETVTIRSQGYWEVASDGGIFNFGSAGFFGSMGGTPLNKPIVAIAAAPDGQGYWEVASDGGIFNFGSAGFFGSTGAVRLNKPIVAIAAAPDGQGYWEVASDGGIFSFGTAAFFGSTGAVRLNKPIVGIAAAPDGQGYWEVASDGGIFSFGTAAFFGSTGAVKLNKPIVGIAAAPDGQGYWEVASDGGLFNFGSAGFLGSMGGTPLNKPIVGAATPR